MPYGPALLVENKSGIALRASDHFEDEAVRPVCLDLADHRAAVGVLQDERRASQFVFAFETIGTCPVGAGPLEAAAVGNRQIDRSSAAGGRFPGTDEARRRPCLAFALAAGGVSGTRSSGRAAEGAIIASNCRET